MMKRRMILPKLAGGIFGLVMREILFSLDMKLTCLRIGLDRTVVGFVASSNPYLMISPLFGFEIFIVENFYRISALGDDE